MTSDQAASPFADIRRLLTEMPGPDGDALAAIRARDAQLTKPPGALGRLEGLVEWLGTWQGKAKPTLDRPMVCVFAGSHGVVERGVSAFPAAVNRQMLENFAAGGAAINQICAAYGLGFRVFDLAVDLPTGDICSGPALDEKGCVATMAFGMEAVAAGTDCLAVGEMGIGNTTVAAAIYAALYGGEAEHWVGRGTGLDAAGLARKAQAVRLALETHKDHLGDPLAVLARLGGREIAAMAGAILAARLQRVPVVLDGYVATAAAAVLHAADPHALDHCIAGHLSAEGAHGEVLERLGLMPLLTLDMRLGEASGAALALGLLKGALACHRDMATFEQAGVSGKSVDESAARSPG